MLHSARLSLPLMLHSTTMQSAILARNFTRHAIQRLEYGSAGFQSSSHSSAQLLSFTAAQSCFRCHRAMSTAAPSITPTAASASPLVGTKPPPTASTGKRKRSNFQHNSKHNHNNSNSATSSSSQSSQSLSGSSASRTPTTLANNLAAIEGEFSFTQKHAAPTFLKPTGTDVSADAASSANISTPPITETSERTEYENLLPSANGEQQTTHDTSSTTATSGPAPSQTILALRHFDVHRPCHSSSLLSLPVLNQLRSILYSTTFVKMAIRASINPKGWKIEPSWDFDDELGVPTGRFHPNWARQQELLGVTQVNPAIVSVEHTAAVTAMQAEAFTSAQIRSNLDDFIVSPYLHTSQEVKRAVANGQQRYLQTADAFMKLIPTLPQHQQKKQVKELRAQLTSTWQQNSQVTVALVNQFIRFMEEPIPTSATAKESLSSAINPSQQKSRSSSEPDSLIKSRSGRLKFDPTLVGLSNMSQPHMWYEVARSIPRKFIIHVGPTNSGKTYHAMQRLMTSRSGVYVGPLRLLAWEVHDKMMKADVPCNLLTGQEVVQVADARHAASTVEMLSTQTIYDVAVIDEAQMVATSDRGWAWTRALLGVAAYEVHVCGDPSMVSIVEELAAVTGEEVEIREYERLTPLRITPPLAGGVRDVRPGDCIVGFSQKYLYKLKYDIEHYCGLKCCIIYGSLPPETRRDQADKFNDPNSGYDVLVATDAIGMGLNLNIKRIIFAKMDKFDGYATRALSVSETLQIGGRAGRYGVNKTKEGKKHMTMAEVAESNAGEVTTLQSEDHAYLRWAMVQPLQPITRAGLAPTQEQLETLHALRPKETLSNLITYFAQYAQLDQLYFNVDMEQLKDVADLVEHVPFRSISERFEYCRCPGRVDNSIVAGAIVKFAELFAAGDIVQLKSYKVPTMQLPTSPHGFSAMEDLYAIADLYVWLALRFGDDQFVDMFRAIEVRDKAAEIIQSGLERISPSDAFLAGRRRAVAKKASSVRHKSHGMKPDISST